MTDDDHDGISQADLSELDDLIRTTTSGLESMQIDTYEKVAGLADEVTKLQDMVKGLGRMIRQEVVPLLPRPKASRPRVEHDGDLVGFSND